MAKDCKDIFTMSFPAHLVKLAQLQQIWTLSKELVLWYSFPLCQAAEENMSSIEVVN